MLDSLQTATQTPDLVSQAPAAARARADGLFENGADADFERILERAERQRSEMRREWADREEEAVLSRREELARAERRKADSAANEAEAEARRAAAEAREAEEAELSADPQAQAEAPRTFRPARLPARTLAFAKIEAETSLPGGFRARVSGELLLTGNLEKGARGVSFGGQSPAGLLKGALESLGSNLELFSLKEGGAEALQSVLLASGMDVQQVADVTAQLFGAGQEADLNGVLRALAGGVDASLTSRGPLGGLTATSEGLNSLGQFLLGLGLSPETVKAVTSGIEPGSILPAATLRSLISGGTSAENLSPLLGEGDLNFLALALQSMGAGPEAAEGLGLMLDGKGGAVSVGDLLTFLETLERPAGAPESQPSPAKAAKDIQTVLANLKSDSELVKAPVFNEILLKLSLLGDRQLDRGFYELSPALQALRGGLGQAAGGGSRPFENGGGDSREERRGREERRVMANATGNAAEAASRGASAASSGAFAAALDSGSVGLASRETLVRELRDKLVYSARRGVRRLRMNLAPESLGGLDVELRVRGSAVTANIRADTLEAYRALEGEVKALRDELAEAGLELKLTLTFAGDGDGREGTDPSGAFYAGDGSRHELGGRGWHGPGRGGARGEGAGELRGEGAPGDADGAGPEDISPPGAVKPPETQGVYAGSLLQAVV
ncbi:MAG: flagellar hook-length control protein FliK [Deltaproteobacteria bacterium]|jgi:hypothetical protein|nr:flagellar hook-length control protein FliK [Deltaproteobacteria bacterium]